MRILSLTGAIIASVTTIATVLAAPQRAGTGTPAERADGLVRRIQQGQPVRVVVIGDSVAQGFYAKGYEAITQTPPGDARGSERFVAGQREHEGNAGVMAQLRSFLQERNAASTLVNESGSGWTAGMMLGQLRRQPEDPLVDVVGAVAAVAPKYDMAIVALGINDCNRFYPYKLSEAYADFRKNLVVMSERLLAAGITPVFFKANDVDRPIGLPGPTFAHFMDVIDDVGREKSVPVIDGYTAFHRAVVEAGGFGRIAVMEDYLHPNQAGHDLLFSVVKAWFTRPVAAGASGR